MRLETFTTAGSCRVLSFLFSLFEFVKLVLDQLWAVGAIWGADLPTSVRASNVA